MHYMQKVSGSIFRGMNLQRKVGLTFPSQAAAQVSNPISQAGPNAF